MSSYPVPVNRGDIQPTNIVTSIVFPSAPGGSPAGTLTTAGFPSFKVYAGQTVRLRAYNGQVAGNQGNIGACSTGRLSDLLSSVNTEQVPPGVEVPFPVNDTGLILVQGLPGDGVQVTIKG